MWDIVSTIKFMLKVLLISPLDPDVPGNLKFLMGGENTYTRILMSYPPSGVKYVHYIKALEDGKIGYTFLNNLLAFLVKFRILPLSAGSKCFKIKDGFDLIHCHAYSIKIDQKVPIILSDSSSNYLFLRDYINWPEWRIKLGYKCRKWLFGKLGVIDSDVNLAETKRLVVFSKFGFRIHRQLGADGRKMTIVPPGLPKPPYFAKSKKSEVVNILFVGIWFERKGGLDVVWAFKVLSQKYKDIRLTIVGPVPKNVSIDHPKIKQVDYVPREKLIRDYFPNANVFVIVPPKVEGFGFAVLEAMSFGIPCIISNVCALPELVEDGKTGFVIKPGSLDELIERLETLIRNENLRIKMGEISRRRFLEKFEIRKSNEQLLKVYTKY